MYISGKCPALGLKPVVSRNCGHTHTNTHRKCSRAFARHIDAKDQGLVLGIACWLLVLQDRGLEGIEFVRMRMN